MMDHPDSGFVRCVGHKSFLRLDTICRKSIYIAIFVRYVPGYSVWITLSFTRKKVDALPRRDRIVLL